LRLATVLLAYTWPHTDVGYTYVGGLMRTGHWQSGYCALVTSSSYGAIPKPRDSSSGWDRYRYAVAALEAHHLPGIRDPLEPGATGVS